MQVEHLSLYQFRNYETAELELAKGINVLTGFNGMGKTNLVEALGYLAHLSSHRVAKDKILIRATSAEIFEQSVIRARVKRANKTALVELELNAYKANRARVNRGSFTRTREILGMVATVLFAPEDLSLVKGDPATRRRFIDEMLVAIAPRFAGVRQDYEKALKQRNALIKQAKKARAEGMSINQASFEIWNEQAAQAGAVLLSARLQMLKRLEPYVESAYAAFTDQCKDVKLKYATSLEDVNADMEISELKEIIMERMRYRFPVEIERGVSVVGPHRDDLEIILGGLPAKGYASHGESWSVALALKLACYMLLRDTSDTGGEPILILDDVFAELDQVRREKLANYIKNAEQVIITAAVAADIPEILVGKKIKIQYGEIVDE
ncbi:MAG: DNA replication/repair protein RecF [Micrococcaceae bacterium]